MCCLSLYLKAFLPFHLLASNNSLVTSLQCPAPRLLTRLRHRAEREIAGTTPRALNNSINLARLGRIPFIYSFPMRAYSYSGPVTIKFKATPAFSFAPSVRAQPFNNRRTPFLPAATHLPPPHPTAQVLQGHTLIVYA